LLETPLLLGHFASTVFDFTLEFISGFVDFLARFDNGFALFGLGLFYGSGNNLARFLFRAADLLFCNFLSVIYSGFKRYKRGCRREK
jgi:hypothetical protein